MMCIAKLAGLSTLLALAWAAPVAAQDATGVDGARKDIAAYSGVPAFTAPGDPFDARDCMKGKKIFTIPASSSIPFIKTISDGQTRLAGTLGFEHMEWENQGNPTQWIQGMDYAANNGFGLVSLLAGADPRFFEPQVRQAQSRGLKVVTSHLTGLEQEAPAGVDAAIAIDYRRAGELMADWTIAKTGGKTNALVVVSNEALSTDSIVGGLKDAFSRCPGCTINIVDVPIVDWATRIQPTVAGALQSNPDLNYVIPIYDSMSTFVTPAIAIAGRGDGVKVATFNGTPFVLDLIRSGDVEMDIGENLDWISHAMLDAQMRLLCGLKPVHDAKVPLRVFDASNVAEAGNPADVAKGYGDAYVAGYSKLWQITK